MSLNDRIVAKVMNDTIPKLIAVIESMHGQQELTNMILQEIWVEMKRKANHQLTEREARDFTDESIKSFKKIIEGNP